MQVMRKDIVCAASLGADGVVAGMLTREGEIDVAQLSELLLLCRSLVWQTNPLLDSDINCVQPSTSTVRNCIAQLHLQQAAHGGPGLIATPCSD